MSDSRTQAEATCERYRPGSCENCSNLKVSKESIICGLTKEETDTLSVCSDYNPNGRRSV
ncbi:MAG: hypothetical protein RBR05_01445 [Candidatus Methanomethylophilaceae archaeon]|nr:hypothetical protein [Candidatus Methanomethylophilaceae archaeon]